MTIIERHEDGMPMGSYQVTYYSLRGKIAVRDAGCDMNVSERYVESAAAKLKPGEALDASCQNSPGGMTAYGSHEMQTAMKAAGY